jgi:hypothetical protein
LNSLFQLLIVNKNDAVHSSSGGTTKSVYRYMRILIVEDQPPILKTSTAAMIGSAVTRRCVVAVRSFSTKSEPVAIGFIGLGNMGFSMAKNLVNAPASLRSKVLVFDMDKSKSKELAGLGAVEAKDIQSMAKECDVIITMLPGPEGIIANAKPGSLLIDSSTIDPLVSRSLHEAATAAKLRMVDAPVSGGVTGAAAGTLTFMVGGTQENLEASKVSPLELARASVALLLTACVLCTPQPALSAMGKNIVHCGDAGAGGITHTEQRGGKTRVTCA